MNHNLSIRKKRARTLQKQKIRMEEIKVIEQLPTNQQLQTISEDETGTDGLNERDLPEAAAS